MEIKVPVIIDGVKTVEELASRVLDDYKYKGMTIRQWADKISNPKTHADDIRAMSDEELSEIFANNDCGYCRIHDFCFSKGSAINCEDVWLEWLKKEAEDGKNKN